MKKDNCPKCFKVVGFPKRYKLVQLLGRSPVSLSVGELTKKMRLAQPTVTHHLQVLKSVGAVLVDKKGRKRLYSIKRDAHCFEECSIPFI
jgi:ArsR family transcriptional regulator, arsenate/arsenite/antimonite-responsive transcriptional repressor